MTSFRVDTHLFRELGALLVGRDSTALAELIKNCYDADATQVHVRGENLSEEKISRIVVSDDGNGMNRREFERGFLTIAARSKSDRTRYSPIYKRRYTGAKGIGRLAAHKLAHVLDVESIPNPKAPHGSGGSSSGVQATLDWDLIESFEHLDQLGGVIDVRDIHSSGASLDTPHGTSITLSKLRRSWTEADLAAFVSEVQGYEPPSSVFGPEEAETYEAPLHPKGMRVRGAGAEGSTKPSARRKKPFSIHLEGDFDRGEDLSPQVSTVAQYVLEIDSRRTGLRYGIARTKSMTNSLPTDLRTPIEPVRLPPLQDGPYFQARIFIRSGASKRWPRSATGVRVYMEGFRVLPYGEPGNDWLGTDSQYTQRGRELVSLGGKYETDALFGEEVPDEGLSMLSASGYIGGVFLTEDNSGGLQMLVNREGFVPGPALDALTATVRRGIDYVTRVRARDKAAKRRAGKTSRSIVTRTRTQALAERTVEMATLVRTVNAALANNDQARVSSSIGQLTDIAEEVAAVTDDLLDELIMIRVLASVGSQLSAFVHELNGLLAVTGAIQRRLRDARSRMDPRDSRATARVSTMLDELRRGLDRQASYLIDVTSADARRRRSAQRVADRAKAVCQMLSLTAQRRHVSLEVDINEDIRTRPMFRAELTAVLTNLLTNAVKAATPADARGTHRSRPSPGASGDDDARSFNDQYESPHPSDASEEGRVLVTAIDTGIGVVIRVSNTGDRVDLADSDRWFDPYATTTTETDPVLGQGTGLGLTITRSLVAENAGTVSFVAPPRNYATAIEVFFPHKRR